jgi:LysR family transcriptional regulator, hydrogen peroxide-inducible genes activator
MISIRQLTYFNALAKELHFGRAAELCCISQPALSMQISELEETLKIQLVVRHSRYITLTTQGKEIARRAQRILTSIDDLADFARHGTKLLTGPLKLGVIPTIGPYLLPNILPLLKTKFPDLAISLRETQTENLLQLLNDNRLDVALLALPVETNEIEQIALFDDPFLLAIPRDHKLSAKNSIALEELQGQRLLLLEEGHCLRDQATSVCQLAGIDGFEEFGASSLATILQMVTNGYGITLLPDLCRAFETSHLPDISALTIKDPTPSRSIGLAWRRTSSRKVDYIELGRVLVEAHKAGTL